MSKIANDKSLPTPPTKPKQRNLGNIGKALIQIPYIIEPDENDPDNPLSPDAFTVLLRPLKYGSYIRYEDKYGCSIDETVAKLMYVLSAVYQHMNSESTDSKFKIEEDEFGAMITPFGKLYGSPQRNTVELASFILAEGGRIVGYDETTRKYEIEEVDPDEIIKRLDPQAILGVDQETQTQSIFEEILTVSNVLNMAEAEKELKDNKEITDDETKNLQTPNEENSSDES